MRLKNLLAKNYQLFGISGIISSWVTIGCVMAGVATLPIIGFCITGGLFGLTIAGVKI